MLDLMPAASSVVVLAVFAAAVPGCSGAAKPPAKPRTAVGTPTPAAPAPTATVSCTDVLRGLHDDQLAILELADDVGARPERFGLWARQSSVVARYCESWPDAVRNCVRTISLDALDQCLTTDELRAPLEPEQSPTCDEVAHDVALSLRLEVAGSAAASDDALMRDVVEPIVHRVCTDDAWPLALRACVSRSSSRPGNCLADQALAAYAPSLDWLDHRLAVPRALFAAAAKFAPKDREITCDRVVKAHYGDSQWPGVVIEAAKAAKDPVVARSRTAMKRACKVANWTPFVRGCVVAAPTLEQRAMCIDVIDHWSYPVQAPAPPAIPGGPTGLADCDQLVLAVAELDTSPSLPDALRGAGPAFVAYLRAEWMTPNGIAALLENDVADAVLACHEAAAAVASSREALERGP